MGSTPASSASNSKPGQSTMSQAKMPTPTTVSSGKPEKEEIKKDDISGKPAVKDSADAKANNKKDSSVIDKPVVTVIRNPIQHQRLQLLHLLHRQLHLSVKQMILNRDNILQQEI